MTTKPFLRKIRALGACPEAVEWLASQPSAAAAWRTCKRGDWMLWLIGRLDKSKPWSNERKPLVRCAVECARLSLRYTKDPRVLACIETVERWCDGKAAREDVEKTRAAAAAGEAMSTRDVIGEVERIDREKARGA